MTLKANPATLAAATLALATFGLAGCSGKESGVFHTDASQPLVMAPPDTPNYGYEGTGMVEATGTMTIHAINSDNTGDVNVDLNVPNYTLCFDVQGAQATYHASATVTPPAPFLLHVVFRTVHVE
ncbi:MAG: hypothetical protein LC623_06590 [Halobacteriales archaeon]|nr:hypothetical protein [Halobacteriales archaeon]